MAAYLVDFQSFLRKHDAAHPSRQHEFVIAKSVMAELEAVKRQAPQANSTDGKQEQRLLYADEREGRRLRALAAVERLLETHRVRLPALAKALSLPYSSLQLVQRKVNDRRRKQIEVDELT